MKQIKQLSYLILLAFAALVFNNCGTDDYVYGDDGNGNGYLSANTIKTSYKAFEVAGISFSEEISTGNYTGSVDSISVVFKAEDSLAWFMVPNLEEGYYDAWVAVDADTVMFSFNVDATEITDVDSEIDEFVSRQEEVNVELDQYIDSLIADSVLGFEDMLSDKQLWAQIAEASKTEIENLDEDGKMELAMLLVANKELFDDFDEMLLGSLPGFKRSSKEACTKLVKQGKQELKEGKTFTALGTSVQAYWCSVKIAGANSSKKMNSVDKAVYFVQNIEIGPVNSYLNTITNFFTRKFDAVTKQTQALTKKTGIASLLEELEELKRQKQLNFRDGEPEALVAKIRFRSIGDDDVNTDGIIGNAARFFDKLINVYDDMIEASEQPLVWRPGFEPKRYAVRKFNRFLSIDGATVSNSDIALINTQIRNDVWEVAFGNDGNEEEPEFTFELVYDDGEVQLEHTVNAKIIQEDNGTFTDPRDNQVYKTVIINGEKWLAENLKFKTANSLVYDNDESNVSKYGRLYSYDDAMTACPDGWHIPSRTEWQKMIEHLGGKDVAGGKLKSTTDWNSPNLGATNETGFNAMPGGYEANRKYFGLGDYGYWRTSTKDPADPTDAYIVRMYFGNAQADAYSYAYWTGAGYSCRCVQD
ncbi:MAG: fibrobacter succinogenes major paralogous domain-containing protein [Bacteroidia bacterium]